MQALETLAVIAYRQPITAIEITEVRGVNTSGVLNTLLERHLIKIVGRKPVVGRPFMYATTKEFLIRFGLNDLNDLPKVEDMAEALGLEAPILIERAPTEEMLPLDEPDEEARGRSGRLGTLINTEGTLRTLHGFKDRSSALPVWVLLCVLCVLGVGPRHVSERRAFLSRSTSSSLSSRQNPTFSFESRIGPIATRLRWLTGWPIASHMFRT